MRTLRSLPLLLALALGTLGVPGVALARAGAGAAAEPRRGRRRRAHRPRRLPRVGRHDPLQRATMQGVEAETRPGVVLGHRHVPVDSVGAYVPGGLYTLIASSYVSVIPAKVVDVGRVVVATPPKGGRVPPALLYSARLAGADEISAVGGVQALAATPTAPCPASTRSTWSSAPATSTSSRASASCSARSASTSWPARRGSASSPTYSADSFVVAADPVGQAEHDPHSRAILVTASRALGEAVIGRMDAHLSTVSTEHVARQCWEDGGEVILVDDEDELVAVCDDYAIEHVEVLVRDPRRMIDRLRHYGSLFVGGTRPA